MMPRGIYVPVADGASLKLLAGVIWLVLLCGAIYFLFWKQVGGHEIYGRRHDDIQYKIFVLSLASPIVILAICALFLLYYAFW